MMNNQDLINIFIEEAHDILDGLREYCYQRDMRGELAQQHLLQEIHTLKGSAKMVGCDDIGSLCHHLEQYTQNITVHDEAKFKQCITDCLEMLNLLVNALESGIPAPDHSGLLSSLKVQPKSTSQSAVLSQTSLQLLHKESVGLCQKFRVELQKIQQGHFEGTIKRLREIINHFRSCALMAQYHQLANYCLLIDDAFIHLQDQSEIDKSNIAGLLDIYGVLMDTVESFISHQPITDYPDPSQLLNLSMQLGSTDKSSEGKKSSSVIRVESTRIEDIGQIAQELNICRAESMGKIGQLVSALSQTEKELKLAHELIRQLELDSDSLVGHWRTDDVKLHSEFDGLEFDLYSQFGQNTRHLGQYFDTLNHQFNYLDTELRNFQHDLMNQAALTTSIEEELVHVRMVSFEHFMPRLKTLVERVSKECDKKVEFNYVKSNSEVDRQVLQKLLPALEHMIRNAIDHGIEDCHDRSAKNKPLAGVITLSCFHQDENLIIELSDDGAGLNYDKIYSKAQQSSMVEHYNSMTQAQLQQLIFQPGFSTKDEATQISGRGMGMDVINSLVKSLGGNIQVYSEEDQGTRFILRLPRLLALNRVLVFTVSEQIVALPMSNVTGIVRLESTDFARYGGVDLPLVTLEHLLDVPDHLAYTKAVIVKTQDNHFAIPSSRIIGHREVVITPLCASLQFLRYLVGFASIGDGKLGLVLCADQLLFSHQLEKQFFQSGNTQRQQCVVVVDDSLTVRKVTQDFLNRFNYRVETATDGLDAFARIDRFQPDLILLDIEMPNMDGFQFLQALRAQEQFMNTPVIVISSRAGDKHRNKAMELGANAYLTKPYSEQNLLNTIREVTYHEPSRQQRH